MRSGSAMFQCPVITPGGSALACSPSLLWEVEGSADPQTKILRRGQGGLIQGRQRCGEQVTGSRCGGQPGIERVCGEGQGASPITTPLSLGL